VAIVDGPLMAERGRANAGLAEMRAARPAPSVGYTGGVSSPFSRAARLPHRAAPTPSRGPREAKWHRVSRWQDAGWTRVTGVLRPRWN